MRRTPSATALPRRRERRKDIANAVNKEEEEEGLFKANEVN